MIIKLNPNNPAASADVETNNHQEGNNNQQEETDSQEETNSYQDSQTNINESNIQRTNSDLNASNNNSL